MKKNIVSYLERVHECNLLACVLESLVRNDDKGVNIFLELFDTHLCLIHSLLAFKSKGFCYDTHCENAHFLSELCYYGSRACACSAAHTCGYEYHVRAFESFLNNFFALFRSLRAYIGVGACSVSFCDFLADSDFCGSVGFNECLHIGVDGDKFYTLDTVGHSVYGIVSAAAYADNLYIYTALVVIIIKVRHTYYYLI